MAFRRIEEIHVGSNPPGMAYGGYIYDIKINFGFNGAATTCTMNIVNEDGVYPLLESPAGELYLNTLSTIPIWISDYGDPKGGIHFVDLPQMHLIEYSIQKTSDAKILTLEFVDHSIWLDKIWVGLAARSAQTHNLVFEPGFSHNEYYFKRRVMTIPIKCHPCAKFKKGDNVMTEGVRENGEVPSIKDYQVPFMAGGGFVSNIHPMKGGALLIGTEEFGNNPCTKREVSYNWRDLVYALNKNNIFIAPNIIGTLPSINDRAKPSYRAKHGSRSLKDVLNAWCQDMGFDWTWDPTFRGNKIIGRDLTVRGLNLGPIHYAVENWGSLTNDRSIISSLNRTHSIKNTKVQDHISTYMKPMRIKDYSDKRYKRVFNKNVRIEQIVPEGQYGMGRTVSELMISAALANFDSGSRELYNIYLADQKFGNADGPQDFGLEPLGIETAYKFSKDEAMILALLFFNPGNIRKPKDKGQIDAEKLAKEKVRKWHSTFKRDYIDSDVYLATYNEKMKDDWEQWEKKIADFFGRHYTHAKDHEDFNSCGAFADYELKVDSLPDGAHALNVSSVMDYPFENILRGAPCGTLEDCDAHSFMFKLKRGCWNVLGVPDEAVAEDKKKFGLTPRNPNNACCGHVFGIPQGQLLVRGRTYVFDQSDPSWKGNDKFGGYGWTYGCDSGMIPGGGPGTRWFMDNCGKPVRGGKVKIYIGGSKSLAPDFTYNGIPGINGKATIRIPDEGTNDPDDPTNRLYLAQDTAPNIDMGCAISPSTSLTDEQKPYAFNDGMNGFGNPWFDRYLVMGEDPNKDKGKERFYFARTPKWGITPNDMKNCVENGNGTNLLQDSLIVKKVITGQIKSHIMTRFADISKAHRNNPRAFQATHLTNSPASFGEIVRRITTSGKKAYILHIPKKQQIQRHFKIGPLQPPKAKNIYETTYKMDEDDEEVTSCKTVCDFTFVDQVCRCWPGEDFDVAPEVNGLLSDISHSFTMAVYDGSLEMDEDGVPMVGDDGFVIRKDEWKTLKVIFPSFHDVAGYHQYNIRYRQVVREVTATAGNIRNGGNAMSYNVNVTPISADIDFLNPDPADTAGHIEPQEEVGVGGVGAGLPGRKGGGDVVANVIIPKDPYSLNPTEYLTPSLDDYHNMKLDGGNVINNDYPSQALDFVVVGGYITPLRPYITPQHGCESLSMSYGPQGLQTSFRFATRYPSPVPDQMAHQQIEPQLNLNVFGRTF